MVRTSTDSKAGPGESGLKRIDAYLALTRSTVYTCVVALLGVAAVFLLVREIQRTVLVIEPISVPPLLARRGYTADVIGSRLADRVQQIYSEAKTSRPRPRLQRASQKPDVQVPGVGLSFQTLVGFSREFFGGPETKIRGEITLEKGRLRLWLRSSTGWVSSEVPIAEPDQLDALIERGGLEIVRLSTPFFAADYLYDIEATKCRKAGKCDFAETRAAIDRSLASGKNEDIKWAEILWGYLLSESLKREQDAIDHYKKALDIDPKFEFAYFNWAWDLNRLGFREEAGEKYSILVKLNPNHADAYNNWGNVFLDLGRREEAIERYRKAIKIDPKHHFAHDNWGIALRELHLPEKAVEKHRRAINLNPKYARAYGNWAITLVQLRCPKEAKEKYRLSIELQAPDADLYNIWGNGLRNVGRLQEAIEMYRIAVKMNPEPAFKENLRTTRLAHKSLKKASKEIDPGAAPDEATCRRYAS